ncbi:MAG: signal peptidase I [Clostridia bacterium]|nr:signal peptidase I [Clostridia bacterium]
MEKVEFSKVNILKKILKLALKIVYDVLMLFCAILIIVVVWQRITDSNKSIYGYRLFRIISGSMVPEYNVDEVVVCKDVDVKNLKIGDIVVYRGKIGDLNGKLIMHEVVDINQIDDNLFFHVKGIQNNTGDPEVSDSQIVGKVIFKSTILTYVYSLASSLYSSFIIITILVINVFVSFRHTKGEDKLLEEKNQKNKKQNEINQDLLRNEKNEIFEEHDFNIFEKEIESDSNDDVDEYEVVRYRLKDYEKGIKIIRRDKKNNCKNIE